MPSVIIKFDGNDYYHLPSDIDLNSDFDFEFDVYITSAMGSYECLIAFTHATLIRPILLVEVIKTAATKEDPAYIEFTFSVMGHITYSSTKVGNIESVGGEWFHIRLYRSGTSIYMVANNDTDLITLEAASIPVNESFSTIAYKTLGAVIYQGVLLELVFNGTFVKNFEGDAEFGYAFKDAAMTQFAAIGEKIYTIENIISGAEFIQATSANQGTLYTGSENTLPVVTIELTSNIDQTVDLDSNIDQTVELNSYMG